MGVEYTDVRSFPRRDCTRLRASAGLRLLETLGVFSFVPRHRHAPGLARRRVARAGLGGVRSAVLAMPPGPDENQGH